MGAYSWEFQSGSVVAVRPSEFVRYVTKLDKEDLKLLSDLMQTGKVTPVIDRTYKLSETAEALRYYETGSARGKIAIAVE